MSALASVLHCAATRDELAAFGVFEGLFDAPASSVEEPEPGRVWRTPAGVFAVTGVGIPHTVLGLAPLLDRYRPALVVNAGIAGAYAESGLAIGTVVLGVSEVFADLGMETPAMQGSGESQGEEGGDAGFLPLGTFAFADEALRAPLPLSAPEIPGLTIRRGRGATVNACTGTVATGARRRRLFDVDFESMEGAAAALAARARGIPMLELRAISNIAARRDMRPENIRRALVSLSATWSQHGRALTEAALHDSGGAPRPEVFV